MRILLLLLLTSCAGLNLDKPKVIYKTKVVEKPIPIMVRKTECVKVFFQMGMKSEEAINACTFIESR